jgi:hypothetical protein
MPSFLVSLRTLVQTLDGLYVLSLPALRALGHVELDLLAFLKRTEAVCLDGGVMDEDVLAVLTAQKSKSLGVIKPLDCACFHCVLFLCCKLPSERNEEVCE